MTSDYTLKTGNLLQYLKDIGSVLTLQGHGKVSFAPSIPKGWNAYSFRIVHRGTALRVRVTSSEVFVYNEHGPDSEISVYGKPFTVSKNSNIVAKLSK